MAIQATDLFSLSANFIPQDSDTSTKKDRAVVSDENGNLGECESMVNERDDFTANYKYCGSDLKTDLGTVLSDFGGLNNSKVITAISIGYQAGQQPTVSVTGIQYPAAVTSINTSDVSGAVPASSGGVTVPTLTGVTLGSASPVSLNINLSLTHVAEQGSDGEILLAENIGFTAEADCEYLGVPSTYDPVTDWTTDETGESDSNSDHDRAKWSGHRYFDAK